MNYAPLPVNAVYYPSWRMYKNIPPSSLPLDKITTIFYAFAIPAEDGSLSFLDDYADTQIPVDAEFGCLNALARVKRKNPHLRTILSIGGGAGSAAFPILASRDYSRHALAREAVEWVNKYSFDGIDINWEHPKTPADGRHYLALLYACRAALPSPRFLLVTALSVDPSVLAMLDVGQVAAVVDHINLMCYDFAGPWSLVAGHHAQLFASNDSEVSSQTGLQYLLSRQVPPQRIIMGIPAYARVFPGAGYEGDSYDKNSGAGGDGKQEWLEIDYREVPEEWKANGVLQIDACRVAAWAVVPRTGSKGWATHPRNTSFVSMDVPLTVRIKASFVQTMGLGGLFYWTGAGDAVDKSESLVAAGFDALYGL